jgi:glycosyltransferase involved in cell wall biosynthesis
MQQNKPKLVRITTIPIALRNLLAGQMRFMGNHGFDVQMVSADGPEIAELMQRENCVHHTVPMTRSITPWQDLLAVWKMAKLLRQLQPAIVHTHTPKAGLVGMLAAKLAGVPHRIHTVAGLRFETTSGFKQWLLKTTEKITYAAATKVWPNSPTMMQTLIDAKLAPASKMSIVSKGSSNGINIEQFSPSNIDATKLANIKSQIQYQDDLFYCLYLGRIVKDKGMSELVEAFLAHYEKNPQLRLLIVGSYEQDLDPIPQALIDTIESHPGIQHIGWTNDVIYYYALSHLFVFPSHREGFPNVLLQAACLQLPIICSRISGNIDIVEDGINGLIFEKDNSASLQAVLGEALQNPAAMKTKAVLLQQKVQQHFSNTVIWQEMLQQYQLLLQQQQ